MMFKKISHGNLEIMLMEMKGLNLVSGAGTKELETACVGPIYFDKSFVGEVRLFYYSGKTAFLQNIEILRQYWNKGYTTAVCEALIEEARKNNCTSFVLEQLQTPGISNEERHKNNEKKIKRICEKLIKKEAVKNYSFKISPETGCYDVAMEI